MQEYAVKFTVIGDGGKVVRNEIRHFPNSQNPHMRFQIVAPDTKRGQEPIYKDAEPAFDKTAEESRDEILGYKEFGDVEVFKLIGFGETLEAAQRMASKATGGQS